MTPQQFSDYIKREVVMNTAASHANILGIPCDKFTDPRWKEIRTSYDSMNESQRKAMRLFGLQAMIDAASNILGVLDGTSIFSEHREEFILRYGDSDQEINGNLQDYFLDFIEDTQLPK